MGRENIDLDGRVAAIEAAAQRIGGPLILVAHSAGCIMTAHWAKRTHCQVIGALLAAPPDLETAMPQGYPLWKPCAQTAGCPPPASRCRFRASSRQARTIRWAGSTGSSNSGGPGAAAS
jgi:Predicted esterase of the alpha/beta hydrolase fold